MKGLTWNDEWQEGFCWCFLGGSGLGFYCCAYRFRNGCWSKPLGKVVWMKKLAILLLFALMLVSFVSANEEIIVTKIDVSTNPLNALALIPAKYVWAPGETVTVKLASSVPCDTQRAYLNVYRVGGGPNYFKDITGLIFPCGTNYFDITFIAPNTEGPYVVEVSYQNFLAQELYRDSAPGGIFISSTGNAECPQNGCTSWTKIQDIPFGKIEERQCTEYNEICDPLIDQQNRIMCNSGYHLNGNNCVSDAGVQECGNNVREGTEDCDFGGQNGVCPALCSLTCVSNTNCEDLPGGGGSGGGNGGGSGGGGSQSGGFVPVFLGSSILGMVGAFLALRFGLVPAVIVGGVAAVIGGVVGSGLA